MKSIREIKIQLRNYFHNNPKRISLAWLLLHVCTAISGGLYVGASVQSLGSFIVSTFGFFVLFPNVYLFSSLPVILVPGYYVLFGFMIRESRNTSSKKFRILQSIFVVWFLLSLFSYGALLHVLYLFTNTDWRY